MMPHLVLALVAIQAAPVPQAQAPSAPSAPVSRALLAELTEQPRLAGTIGSKVGADIVKRHLEAAGWKVELDEREVLLSYPRSVEIAVFDDGARDSKPLAHRIERFDPDAIPPGDVPKYNAWSASGKLRAPVVDAGYGTRADFERLKSAHVDLAGKVALVRYGRSYRGIKVDLAMEFGCAAVLLYSDPASDGPEKGDVWPKGPWKPLDEAQRGSIHRIAHAPGDPSTPGWASPKPGTAGASGDVRRLHGEQLDDALPRIPCLPIGAGEARSMLERLAPVNVKRTETKDGKPVDVVTSEKLGPGPCEVELALDMPRSLRTIVNVVARLPGASDACVIAGAHRDAWVRGANDDGAGTVALLRAAQHLGERVKQGWKPPLTVVLGFWDAEEFGLIGSTEWGEANAPWLREHALAYVNADTCVNGPRFSGASGSPGVLGGLREVLARIPAAPRASGEETPANLWDEWRGRKQDEPELSLPGSGSDFTVFVHHLGVPALDLNFGGGQGGQYHTHFDDLEHVERFIDPGFVGHELAGKLFAELLATFAERGAERDTLTDPIEAARSLAAIAARERDALKAPESPLARALNQVATALGVQADELAKLDPSALHGFHFYRALERADGLRGRAWFVNDLWAPGLEDGYGSETFPMLRAAARQGDAELAREFDLLLARIALARPGTSGSSSPRASAPKEAR